MTGPLPPVLFLVALLLQVGLHLALPARYLVPPPWSYLGALLILFGVVVNVLADRQFKRARTAIHPFQTPSALVTEGVFRYTRNPMYVGLAAVLLGVAVALGSLTPFLVPPLFAMLVARRFISHEERALVEQFGEAYVAYARRVRRWV